MPVFTVDAYPDARRPAYMVYSSERFMGKNGEFPLQHYVWEPSNSLSMLLVPASNLLILSFTSTPTRLVLMGLGPMQDLDLGTPFYRGSLCLQG